MGSFLKNTRNQFSRINEILENSLLDSSVAASIHHQSEDILDNSMSGGLNIKSPQNFKNTSLPKKDPNEEEIDIISSHSSS